MRAGKRIMTSQVHANEYKKAFEEAISEGYDILSLSVSTGLSSSYYASVKVKDELLKKYNDAKIICIDTLRACLGLGMICIRASELRSEGKTIEEVAKWSNHKSIKLND